MPTATRRVRSRNVPQATAAQKAEQEAVEQAEREAERIEREREEERREREEAEREWAELVERCTEGDSSPAKQIRLAISLENQLGEIREKITRNRSYLRFMDDGGELSEEQQEFVDVFYGEKRKGEHRSDDDLAATKLAKRLARNGSTVQA